MSTEIPTGPTDSATADTASEVEAPDTEPKTKGGKRLSTKDWAEIDTHWECGSMKAVDMAEKYDISPQALTAHFRRHKIARNSKAHLLKKTAEIKIMGAVAAAEEPLAVSFEQKRRGRIAQTRERCYTLSAIIRDKGTKIIKEIHDGVRTPAECASDLKGLRHAQLLIRHNQADSLSILKADSEIDEANLPTLIFRDLSEEEIQARSEGDDEDDLGIGLPDDLTPLDEESDDIVVEGVPSSAPSS